jgi:hypothetical protein
MHCDEETGVIYEDEEEDEDEDENTSFYMVGCWSSCMSEKSKFDYLFLTLSHIVSRAEGSLIESAMTAFKSFAFRARP